MHTKDILRAKQQERIERIMLFLIEHSNVTFYSSNKNSNLKQHEQVTINLRNHKGSNLIPR